MFFSKKSKKPLKPAQPRIFHIFFVFSFLIFFIKPRQPYFSSQDSLAADPRGFPFHSTAPAAKRRGPGCSVGGRKGGGFRGGFHDGIMVLHCVQCGVIENEVR